MVFKNITNNARMAFEKNFFFGLNTARDVACAHTIQFRIRVSGSCCEGYYYESLLWFILLLLLALSSGVVHDDMKVG